MPQDFSFKELCNQTTMQDTSHWPIYKFYDRVYYIYVLSTSFMFAAPRVQPPHVQHRAVHRT